MLSLPAQAVDAPASIENARIERGAGVEPRQGDRRRRSREDAGVGGVERARRSRKRSDVCCYTNNFKRRGCSLSDRDSSWGTSDNFDKTGATDIYVLVEVKRRHGRAGFASSRRAARSTAPIAASSGSIRSMPGASLAALSKLLEADDEERLRLRARRDRLPRRRARRRLDRETHLRSIGPGGGAEAGDLLGRKRSRCRGLPAPRARLVVGADRGAPRARGVRADPKLRSGRGRSHQAGRARGSR